MIEHCLAQTNCGVKTKHKFCFPASQTFPFLCPFSVPSVTLSRYFKTLQTSYQKNSISSSSINETVFFTMMGNVII